MRTRRTDQRAIVCISLSLSFFATLALAVDQTPPSTRIERPAGVPLSKKALYEPVSGMFKCLDGLASLPMAYVNDDYCDCADGSDEPGTSACRNGQFYCENKGYVPRDIPSSRINDGICDCCDGSDELNTKVHCSNTCFELGKALRQEAERQYEVMKSGYEVRQQYMAEANMLKSKTELELREAEQHLSELEQRKVALEEAKKAAEEAERQSVDAHKKSWEKDRNERNAEIEKQRARSLFEMLDTNGDGRVTREDLLPHMITNQHTLTPEQATFIGSMPAAYHADEWVHDTWPHIKSILKQELMDRLNPYGRGAPSQGRGEIMKNICFAGACGCRENLSPSETTEPPASQEVELTDPSKDEHDERLPDDVEGAENEDLPDFPPEDKYDEKYAADEDDDDKDADSDADAGHNKHETSNAGGGNDADGHEPPYDEQTQALVDQATKARDEFRNADNEFRSEQTRVDNLKQSVKNDYGPDGVFWPLHGKCFDFSDREYTYTMCPFDKVTQQGRGGGGNMNLGTWGKWMDNSYTKMMFEHGQKCWNGPDRSAMISLQCGVENRLLSATEPDRCAYTMTFETPAACPEPPSDKDRIIEEALKGAANDDDMLRHLEL